MRLAIFVTAAFATAFTLAGAVDDWAEAEIVGSYEHKSVISFELTEAQLTAVENAKGEDVEIKLTEKQIRAIVKATGFEDVRKTATLNSTHLRSGNKVVLGFKNVKALESLTDLTAD
ncbi:MAG: hypothetical protein JSW52_09855 [Candidatus Coatesbacteria bacterium]|nr:MAG: hypothetical protein JSW52_09855 [Candidatus Coatesbacteria bacterium]